MQKAQLQFPALTRGSLQGFVTPAPRDPTPFLPSVANSAHEHILAHRHTCTPTHTWHMSTHRGNYFEHPQASLCVPHSTSPPLVFQQDRTIVSLNKTASAEAPLSPPSPAESVHQRSYYLLRGEGQGRQMDQSTCSKLKQKSNCSHLSE